MFKSRDPKTRKAKNRADATLRSERAVTTRLALFGRELNDTSASINSLRADVINLIDRVRQLEANQRRPSADASVDFACLRRAHPARIDR
jgi:hypothetical protein